MVKSNPNHSDISNGEALVMSYAYGHSELFFGLKIVCRRHIPAQELRPIHIAHQRIPLRLRRTSDHFGDPCHTRSQGVIQVKRTEPDPRKARLDADHGGENMDP